MEDYFARHVIRLGSGQPMLLLHGVGHRKEAWDPVLAALGDRYDVVAIDLPGFGGAPELPSAPDDHALADWCEQVMDEMGWHTAHIVGNSMGGLIALRLGGRGRARSVTAISPVGQIQGWERHWANALLSAVRMLGPWLARVPWFSDSATRRRLALSTIFGRPERMNPAYARLSMEGLGLATAFRDTFQALDLHAQDVKPIEVPVTIAWGSRDRLLLPRQGLRWSRALPGSRLVTLPGLGHTPMPDDPDMVAEVIARTAG
ncbi:MAG: alpha/beta fold hydrolase [Euzebya sp.]